LIINCFCGAAAVVVPLRGGGSPGCDMAFLKGDDDFKLSISEILIDLDFFIFFFISGPLFLPS
jgi:hypothetical protein